MLTLEEKREIKFVNGTQVTVATVLVASSCGDL